MKPSTLAIHGGKPVKTTPFRSGAKHNLAEWRALKPIFQRGNIHMARGPEVMKLREAFRQLHGRKYAVTTSSGTAALHTALGALLIGRGDEIITSPMTDMGTIVAIMQLNAVVVFADIDPLTHMITPHTVSAKLTRKTRAVVPVHLAGQPCDVRGIKRALRGRNIAIVEDVAQSYLARQGKALCGTIGDIGCWSLNESKHIGAGDGGVLLTNNKALADRADLFADKCYDRGGGPIAPFFAPYNYRMNTLAAAVSLQQLKKLDRLCAKRNALGTRLDALIARAAGMTPRPRQRNAYATYWFYIFNVDPNVISTDAGVICDALRAEGVWATPMSKYSILQWPLFTESPDDPHACGQHCPLYGGKVDYRLETYPGVRQAMRYSIRMPFSEHYTASDINAIGRAVRKVAAYYAQT